uniref:Uncharacterized protein n=1 Tax=Cucumis melo TaxID=3656 RepID=A0A9I9CTY1_CUCME
MGEGQGAFSLLAVIHIDNVKVAAAGVTLAKEEQFFWHKEMAMSVGKGEAEGEG